MEKRIIELEKKVAFQEDALEELNEVISQQYRKIEAMEKQLEIIKNELSEERLVKPQEEEEPPPHY